MASGVQYWLGKAGFSGVQDFISHSRRLGDLAASSRLASDAAIGLARRIEVQGGCILIPGVADLDSSPEIPSTGFPNQIVFCLEATDDGARGFIEGLPASFGEQLATSLITKLIGKSSLPLRVSPTDYYLDAWCLYRTGFKHYWLETTTVHIVDPKDPSKNYCTLDKNPAAKDGLVHADACLGFYNSKEWKP